MLCNQVVNSNQFWGLKYVRNIMDGFTEHKGHKWSFNCQFGDIKIEHLECEKVIYDEPQHTDHKFIKTVFAIEDSTDSTKSVHPIYTLLVYAYEKCSLENTDSLEPVVGIGNVDFLNKDNKIIYSCKLNNLRPCSLMFGSDFDYADNTIIVEWKYND